MIATGYLPAARTPLADIVRGEPDVILGLLVATTAVGAGLLVAGAVILIVR